MTVQAEGTPKKSLLSEARWRKDHLDSRCRVRPDRRVRGLQHPRRRRRDHDLLHAVAGGARAPQITSDLLVPLEANINEAPPNAYDLVSVRDCDLFSKIPLEMGDVISASNSGPLERIRKEHPPIFVAASLAVAPENAAGGKVRTGGCVDVIAVNDEPGDPGASARVVLYHALVIDVTLSPQTIADSATDGQEGENLNPGPASAQVRSGIPSVYPLGVSRKDATKLALIGDNVRLVLSRWHAEVGPQVRTQYGDVFAPARSRTPPMAPRGSIANLPPVDATSTDWAVDPAADPLRPGICRFLYRDTTQQLTRNTRPKRIRNSD